MEHRISGPGPLLDATGRLREPGWSDALVLDYDRDAIRAPGWRIKEWDYYCVLAGDFGIALTIADNGYMGLLSATVFDFAEPRELTDTIITAFPMGRWGLPRSSRSGISAAKSGNASLRFEASEAGRRLSFSWPEFAAAAGPPASVGLEGEIFLREAPGVASMVIATPFAKPRRAFYYNQKINCQSAEGRFRLGPREFALEPASSFAVLDWGRGVWPWSNSWLWGSASGLARRVASGEANRADGSLDGAGERFGFNIGYGFGDTSAASENMVFFCGKAHKIGKLTISLDEKDFLKPWRATSEDGRLDMTLEPILDRVSKTDFGLLASIQHQVFGSWKGYALLDDGSRIEVGGLRGFCEKVVNRW
jgi:hypothetical protein